MAQKLIAGQKEVLARLNATPKLFHQIVTAPHESATLANLVIWGYVAVVDHPTCLVRVGVPACAYTITPDGTKALTA